MSLLLVGLNLSSGYIQRFKDTDLSEYQLQSLPSTLFDMSTTPASIRQRSGQNTKKAPPPPAPSVVRDDDANGSSSSENKVSGITSEWDYKVALAIITALAFATRFWGIGHPNEVVFDEVHFGKVCYAARLSGIFPRLVDEADKENRA